MSQSIAAYASSARRRAQVNWLGSEGSHSPGGEAVEQQDTVARSDQSAAVVARPIPHGPADPVAAMQHDNEGGRTLDALRPHHVGLQFAVGLPLALFLDGTIHE